MACKNLLNQANSCSYCDKLSQYLWHYPIKCSQVINVVDQWWCILPVPETVHVSGFLTLILLHSTWAFLATVVKNHPTCPAMIIRVQQQELHLHQCADQPGMLHKCFEAEIVIHPYCYLLGVSSEILFEGKSPGYPTGDVVLSSGCKMSYQTRSCFLWGDSR